MVRRQTLTSLPLVLASLAPACVDALDQQTSIIDAPRILAVIPSPAEAPPGAEVSYTAVVATPDGTLVDPPLAWSYCTAPKPPTEDNVVAPPCLDDPSALLALGTAPTITATLPDDACRLHGPDTPPGGFRPRDPDPSGGYYQPIRADLSADAPIAFGLHRISCNLGDAPPDIVRAYRDRYTANNHPTLTSFTAEAAPDTSLTLTVTWPDSAAEPYVLYDRATVALVDRRESLRVAWFATAGTLASDATGPAPDGLHASVTWTAPATPPPNPVVLWAVLHDDRGGIAVSAISTIAEVHPP